MKGLKENRKKGFTLIELIVSITIILILSSVMIPSTLKYIEQARIANCKQDAAAILMDVQVQVAEQMIANTALKDLGNIESNGVTVERKDDVNLTSPETSGRGQAFYQINAMGNVEGFSYRDGAHFAVWHMATGWEIDGED